MQVKKYKNFEPKTVANSDGFFHRVRLQWKGQSNYLWNEACADIVEVFGLPGDRFISSPQVEYMDFFFKSTRDAELCKILLSDKF